MQSFEINKVDADKIVKIDALSRIGVTDWYVALRFQKDIFPICGHDYVLDGLPGVEDGTLGVYTYTNAENDGTPIWLNRVKSSPAPALLFEDSALWEGVSVVGEAVGWLYAKSREPDSNA